MPTARTIYRRALARLGLNWPDGMLDQTNDEGVLAAYNDAIAEFTVDHDWLSNYVESTFTTSVGLDTYQLPPNWYRTSWLVLQDEGIELQARQRREHFQWPNVPNGGPPRWFDISGDRILIAPIPGRSYVVRHGYFVGWPAIERDATTYPDLEDQMETVTVEIPDIYLPLVILYLARSFCLLIKDQEAYRMVETEIATYRQKVQDNRRRMQAPGRIVTRQDY